MQWKSHRSLGYQEFVDRMESVSSVKWVAVIFLIQVLWCGIGESQHCAPGFGSDLFLFRVPTEHLHKGTRIGTIVFNDCSGRTHTDFTSTDTQYHVDSDGSVKLKRHVTLHNGHKMFSVHAWDSMGKKHTALVRVELNKDQADHHHSQPKDVNIVKSTLTESPLVLPLSEFPSGLSRSKREWVFPIRIIENDRGTYPRRMVQIRSSQAKDTTMVYSITGEGADLPPVGLFTIDKSTGWLYVTGPLDRELKNKYELQTHVYSATDNIHGSAMDVTVEVLDQNDNSPVFTQNPFIGRVPEASNIGFEFMTITATDADDPDTDNADVRYSIISQTPSEPSPNMFEINPITGAIHVNADGLNIEKHPEYTLEIQAADMQGEGRSVTGKAVITVTDGSDESLTKVKWVIPPIPFLENEQGLFPKQKIHIKSRHAKETKMVYSITGEGADLPPVGLFTIDRNTGWLYVTGPLDRELKDKYKLQAHAHSATDNIKESTEYFTVKVLDQNDNSPVFTRNPFIGSVPEASKIGFEFMTITATDADDPNTNFANVRYSIISQTPSEPSPNMFEVNPVTGAIRVNADGLNREKHPEYTLEIQAADMQGEGRWVTGKAVITVTDGSDKSLAKVEFVFPLINLLENQRGPFPKQMVQMKSSHAKQTKVVYNITGEGADQPPVGLFTIDKDSGWISVTTSLDREIKHEYVLQVHATSDGVNEHPIDLTIRVIDQNDNKPVFTQDLFSGSVPEASKIGFEIVTISATDADDPNTENANIRYSIISQDPVLPQPNMFEINPVSGLIQLNAEGLDREKYPQYTLEVQAADMEGNGLQSRGKAVITVTV